MTWFSETFYWLPAIGRYGNSIQLLIDDGYRIQLTMDNCKASPTNFDCICDPECGYGDYCSRRLDIKELKELHIAIGKAIEYYNIEVKKKNWWQ